MNNTIDYTNYNYFSPPPFNPEFMNDYQSKQNSQEDEYSQYPNQPIINDDSHTQQSLYQNYQQNPNFNNLYENPNYSQTTVDNNLALQQQPLINPQILHEEPIIIPKKSETYTTMKGQKIWLYPDSMTKKRIDLIEDAAKGVIDRIRKDEKNEQKFYMPSNWIIINCFRNDGRNEAETTMRIAAGIILTVVCVFGIGSIVKECGNWARAKDYMYTLLPNHEEVAQIKKDGFEGDHALKERALRLFTGPDKAVFSSQCEIVKRIIIKVITVAGAALGAIGAFCAIEALFSVGVLALSVGSLVWAVNSLFCNNYKGILMNNVDQLKYEAKSLKSSV